MWDVPTSGPGSGLLEDWTGPAGCLVRKSEDPAWPEYAKPTRSTVFVTSVILNLVLCFQVL